MWMAAVSIMDSPNVDERIKRSIDIQLVRQTQLMRIATYLMKEGYI
jgi:hypothetical protein